MKYIIGLLVIALEIIFFLYLGVWVGWIGGVVQFIESVKMDDIPALGVAVALARFFIVPTISFWVGFFVVATTIASIED